MIRLIVAVGFLAAMLGGLSLGAPEAETADEAPGASSSGGITITMTGIEEDEEATLLVKP